MDGMSEQSKKDDDILSEMRAFKKDCEQADGHNRKEMEDDLRFLEGHGQWDDRIKAQREADGRPCLTINKLPQYVNQVANDIRQSRPSIKVRPVDSQSDPEKAKLLEGLIRNIEYVSKADQAYDTAGFYAVAGGFGVILVETAYTDDDSFEQDIRIKRVRNPMTVFIDPNSEDADGADMTRALVTSLMPAKTFKKKYPKAAATSSVEGSEWADWFTSETVRLAEFWTREQVMRPIALLRDGTVVDADQADKSLIVSTRNAPSWKVTYRLCTGSEVLETKEWPGKYIPIVPVYGEEIDINGKVYRRGLIRNAKDVQRMYNYWRTTATEIVALAPKAPMLVTGRQIEGHENEWASSNVSPRPYLTYNNDAQAPLPQRIEPASVPQGVFTEAQVAVDDIKSVMGIYDSSLGARSNETSGRAIMMREKQGDNATFVYPDNVARAIAQVGRIVVDLIPKIYDAARMVRVLGEDGEEEIVQVNQPGIDGLLNDLTIGKYDIVVQSGPSYATKRMEAAETMMQFVQAQPQLAPLIGDLIAKNMDWPGADKIAERLVAMLPPQLQALENKDDQQAQVPPQLQQMIQQGMEQIQQQQAALTEMQAKLDDKNSEHEAKERELAIKEYDAETKRLQVTQAGMQPEQVAAIAQQTVMDLLTVMQAEQQEQYQPFEHGPQMDQPKYEPPEYQEQPTEGIGLMPPQDEPNEPGQAPGFLSPQ